MMPNLIDTHFHLDFYKNHKEIYVKINELKQYTLCMTNSPGVYLSCKKLYPETKYIKFALGFHPLENTLSDRDFADFLLISKSVKYIGEVGVDLKSKTALNKEKQLYYFERIVEMCAAENKVFSVHLRGSETIAIEILKRHKPKKCIIHWFTGTISQLEELSRLGCYFSVNYNMAQRKNALFMLKLIHKDRMLIESDGPFTKVNGVMYRPQLLFDTYNKVSKVINDENLILHIYNNFEQLLSI